VRSVVPSLVAVMIVSVTLLFVGVSFPFKWTTHK
jgi:hypothetical protein